MFMYTYFKLFFDLASMLKSCINTGSYSFFYNLSSFKLNPHLDKSPILNKGSKGTNSSKLVITLIGFDT